MLRLRDAIQSIIACESHEDLPQLLGADSIRVTIFMRFTALGWVMTPRCIETLAEFSTPENHQRIDEAFFNGHLGGRQLANLWGKSHDFFVAGCFFFFFYFLKWWRMETTGLALWVFAVFGEAGSSWTKWAG